MASRFFLVEHLLKIFVVGRYLIGSHIIVSHLVPHLHEAKTALRLTSQSDFLACSGGSGATSCSPPGSLVLDGGVGDVLDANLGLSLLAARQLCRISTPPRTRIQDLALHQEGIGVENDVVSGNDAVVNKGPRANRASVTQPDVVGLEHAFLERMCLHHTSLVQIGVVADLDQRALRSARAASNNLAPTFMPKARGNVPRTECRRTWPRSAEPILPVLFV